MSSIFNFCYEVSFTLLLELIGLSPPGGYYQASFFYSTIGLAHYTLLTQCLDATLLTLQWYNSVSSMSWRTEHHGYN